MDAAAAQHGRPSTAGSPCRPASTLGRHLPMDGRAAAELQCWCINVKPYPSTCYGYMNWNDRGNERDSGAVTGIWATACTEDASEHASAGRCQ